MNVARRSWFEVVGILGLGVSFLLAWAQCHVQADRASLCERELGAVKDAQKPPLDDDQLRRVAWEAQKPCGLDLWEYPFKSAPTSGLCKLARDYVREQRQRKVERILEDEKGRLRYRMLDCANSGVGYDSGPKADSVEAPYVHDSWVLGGECEGLAHELQKREEGPMCVDFVDDDHESAERCRRELEAWAVHLCSEKDLSDDARRDCFSWHTR